MLVMDANFSLKHMGTLAGHHPGNTRSFTDSKLYLDNNYIDRFANEVRARPVSPLFPADDTEDEENTDAPAEQEGDPTDGVQAQISSCTSNWKAAASDEKKRAWGIFEETGIFACACRHGQVMWISDMIRSGELYVRFSCMFSCCSAVCRAKYPLAMVSKALEVFDGRLRHPRR